jgi:hypothetical protein
LIPACFHVEISDFGFQSGWVNWLGRIGRIYGGKEADIQNPRSAVCFKSDSLEPSAFVDGTGAGGFTLFILGYPTQEFLMNRTTRNITASATMFAAAMTGMLAGCASHSGADSGSAAVSSDLSKHACKGQNQCKGYGGCKTM